MTFDPPPLPTRRADLIERLKAPHTYDIAIIGGGATGLGVALDAAARGFSVVVVESHDFAKGTSSRATKLVHGGVRYLAQGNISLVREPLHERGVERHPGSCRMPGRQELHVETTRAPRGEMADT